MRQALMQGRDRLRPGDLFNDLFNDLFSDLFSGSAQDAARAA
jgi:hypothetical protein